MFSYYKTEMLDRCREKGCPHKTRFRLHFMFDDPTPMCRKCFRVFVKPWNHSKYEEDYSY